MNVRALFMALACTGLVAALAGGCGSKDSASGGATDAGGTDSQPDGASDGPTMCMGLDATAGEIGFPPKCEDCIAARCCEQYQTCFADPGCKVVEVCTGNCIENEGMSPLTCATKCAAQSDSGPVTAEANALNACIVAKCPLPCSPSSN